MVYIFLYISFKYNILKDFSQPEKFYDSFFLQYIFDPPRIYFSMRYAVWLQSCVFLVFFLHYLLNNPVFFPHLFVMPPLLFIIFQYIVGFINFSLIQTHTFMDQSILFQLMQFFNVLTPGMAIPIPPGIFQCFK